MSPAGSSTLSSSPQGPGAGSSVGPRTPGGGSGAFASAPGAGTPGAAGGPGAFALRARGPHDGTVRSEGAGRLSRRGLLAAFGLAPLGAVAGCGFEPLYGERSGLSTRAAEQLAKVRVAPISERNGVLLRRALEQRMRPGRESEARYELRCGLTFGVDIQGYRRDGVPSRVRYTATASWFLFSTAIPPVLVANGTERFFDAYNIPENQFFAADASRYAMEQRIIDQLAEDMVVRLAVVLTTNTYRQDTPAG